MSKRINLLLALLLVCGGAAALAEDGAKKPPSDQNKEAIRPFVGEKFGTVMTVEGSFVPKNKSYHDQVIVKGPHHI